LQLTRNCGLSRQTLLPDAHAQTPPEKHDSQEKDCGCYNEVIGTQNCDAQREVGRANASEDVT
jgi:hypothetical protein